MGGSIATGIDQAELAGALTGHALTAVTLTASSTESTTTEGTIIPSAASIQDGETDVTANYDIRYVYNDKAAGEEITVSLPPDADGKYTFTMPDSWVSVRPEYSLNRAHKIINELGDGPSVYLVFRKDEYNMFTVETTTANAGDTVRVYPNGGTLQDFKVNGTEVKVSGYESDPYYEFTMPDEDATLTGSVTYRLQTYWVERGTVTVQVGDGEVIEMSGGTSLSVPAGARVTVTATPDEGYKLYRLSYRMDDRYGRGSDEKGGVEIQSGVPFTMPGGNIVIDAEFNTPWNHLRNQIDNARDGDTITLTEDAIARAGEGCLGISYKSITVDLNGHTINRNLTAPTDYGCVISVDSSAALTLLDSKGGGKITGGNNNYNGGGIAVAGTLNLQGGKITGNSASDGGGVAVISSGAVFTLTGGEISGNANTTERSSAGVLYTSGAMNVSGSPVVTDAVYVDLNRKLHVTGPLTNATPIPVIIAGGVSVPFTDGLPNNGNAANFKSADDDYRVRVNADGEAELKTVYSVTVAEDIANGTVTADLTTAIEDDAVTLTATPAEGYAFSHFTVTDASGESVSVSPEGRIIMPDSNVTVTATFITEWKWLQNRMAEGWTITLEKDITCADQSEGPLVVPTGVTSTLDLNGHTVDRGLAGQDAVEGGNVISVIGTLTVNDSSTDKTGKITGGNNTDAGGGVIVGKNGKFTLNGGAVTGNRTDSNAGGLINSGTLNMTGGAISDNNARDAGGVNNLGTFNLSGGEIRGNTASDNFGGGVNNNHGGIFNMSGSASIVGNHAASGGGVFNSGAFTLSESASITDNTANDGGGVANMGTFNMNGSAAITGNTATEAGGGLYDMGSAITLSGDIALSGNTGGDIHLLEVFPENKPVLNISGALTNADPIGVSYEVLEGTPPDTIPFTQGLNGNGSAANFKSADENYRVRVNDAGEAELYALTFHTVTFDPDNGDEATTKRVAENETAARPEDPTKEGHRFLGWYADGATEAFDFNTAITGDITLTARWAAPVTLSAYTRTDNNALALGSATVTDGTIYTGDTVTVSVKSQNGYSFLGWYKATEFSDGNVTAYGDKVASTLKYTFGIMEDTALVAVYQENKKATLSISTMNGAKFTIGSSTTKQTAIQNTYNVGTVLTLTAVDGDKVLHWLNESNKVISTAESIDVTVSSNMAITLVYKAEEPDQSFVQFVNDYGQVLTYMQYSQSDSTVIFPDSPTKFGYTFDKWVFDGTDTEATSEAILEKVGTVGTIIIKPSYTKDQTAFTVTVRYVNGSNDSIGDGSVEYTGLVVGTNHTFNAPVIDGYQFSCWKNASGTILGYKTSYCMNVEYDTTLIACYVLEDVVVEVQPVITIGEMYTVTSGSVHKVSNSATRNIPTGYSLIEHGILYARDIAGLTETTFVWGTEGVGKYISNDTAMNGVVKLNVKVATDNVMVSLRGYMVLRDNNTGNEAIYYTDISTGSYSSINN